MEGHTKVKLRQSQSTFPVRSPAQVNSGTASTSWKSDIDISVSNDLSDIVRSCLSNPDSDLGRGEYYKKYEHDDIPVKENKNDADGDRASLTNSQLEKLEMKVLKNMPEDIRNYGIVQTSSLDSNIKFFKTTVENIFDSFYANMQDFDLYKKRYNDIVARNREEALDDMEDFIKDLIQHILMSEPSSMSDCRINGERKRISGNKSLLNSVHSIIEEYKNDNYLTESTHNENNTASSGTGETFNIFLLTDRPVEIQMNKHKTNSSEINIKKTISESIHIIESVASAENFRKIAAKRLQIQKRQDFVDSEESTNVGNVKEIPIKESRAMQNIYQDEHHRENAENNKSFITKFCSYICKKIRRC